MYVSMCIFIQDYLRHHVLRSSCSALRRISKAFTVEKSVCQGRVCLRLKASVYKLERFNALATFKEKVRCVSCAEGDDSIT